MPHKEGAHFASGFGECGRITVTAASDCSLLATQAELCTKYNLSNLRGSVKIKANMINSIDWRNVPLTISFPCLISLVNSTLLFFTLSSIEKSWPGNYRTVFPSPINHPLPGRRPFFPCQPVQKSPPFPASHRFTRQPYPIPSF